MKKTAIQRYFALPLALLFAAMLLVCAVGFTADAHAASDGTRPLTITSSDPAAAYTVSWAGYSADYAPGMAVPMLLPVTITCTNRTVSGWDLAGGWGGADAVLLPAGNSATLSAAAHDSGSVTIQVTVSADADADADADWSGSASDGSGDHGSGSEGSGTEGSGLPGSGNEGSGSNGSGNNGSGNNGSGLDGSGNHGSGFDGSGNNGSGLDGSGFDGSGFDGSGIDGSADKGSDKNPNPAPQDNGSRSPTPGGSGAKTGDARMVLVIVLALLLSAAVFALTYRSWRRQES